MPQYKLSYFDAKGAAEIARLCFAAGGIQFEDNRYNKETWPEFKPSTPYGQLPVLEVDGTMLAESLAIARYVAKEAGLTGSSNMECGQINAYVDMFVEMRNKAWTTHSEKDGPEKDEKRKKLFEEDFPNKMKQVEAKLKTGDKYLVGNKLTLADIVVFSIYDGFSKVLDFYKDSPKLKAITENVKNEPKIKAYLAKRKETDY